MRTAVIRSAPAQEQAGTFMHELGHALGLDHGGSDAHQQQAQLPERDELRFQRVSVRAAPAGATTPIPGGCDYSRLVVNLDERLPPGPRRVPGPGTGARFRSRQLGLGTHPAVLEGVTCPAPNTNNVSANINNDSSPDTNNNGVLDPGETPPSPTSLASTTGPTCSSTSRAGELRQQTAIQPVANEPDPRTIERAQRHLGDILAPGIAVTVSGPATALPGESLTYTIRTANEGDGPAFGVGLAATRPGGSISNFSLGDLIVGADVPARSGTRPSDACPQTLTVGGRATFADFVGVRARPAGRGTPGYWTSHHPRSRSRCRPPRCGPRITSWSTSGQRCRRPTVRSQSRGAAGVRDQQRARHGPGDGNNPEDVAGAALGTMTGRSKCGPNGGPNRALDVHTRSFMKSAGLQRERHARDSYRPRAQEPVRRPLSLPAATDEGAPR